MPEIFIEIFEYFFALFVIDSCGFITILTVYWAFSKKLEFGKMVAGFLCDEFSIISVLF